MKFFRTPEEIREDAKKLIKFHGIISVISYAAIVGFILLVVLGRKEETNSIIAAFGLGFTFLVLLYLRIFYYVCPTCSGSLFRLRRHDRQKLFPYCPHCGTHIFPEISPETYDGKDKLAKILRVIVILGFISLAVIGVSGQVSPRYLAIGIVVLLYLTFLLATMGPKKACRKCHHRMGRNKFCENCGAPSTKVTLSQG